MQVVLRFQVKNEPMMKNGASRTEWRFLGARGAGSSRSVCKRCRSEGGQAFVGQADID
jgi:hypothetical protein